MYHWPTEGESVPLTQAPHAGTWPVTRCYRVTGPPHGWLGAGQPWLRIRATFDRVPTAHSLAAPGTAAAANSGL